VDRQDVSMDVDDGVNHRRPSVTANPSAPCVGADLEPDGAVTHDRWPGDHDSHRVDAGPANGLVQRNRRFVAVGVAGVVALVRARMRARDSLNRSRDCPENDERC
jgi:hypothetical protein